MKPIRIFEHSWLSFKTDKEIDYFKKIVDFNEKNNSKYFQIGNNKIKSSQFVGILSIDGYTIEILPKISKRDNENLPWGELLTQMLLVANNVKINRALKGHLDKDKRPILDIYLMLFLEEVEKVIRSGLIKKYKKVEENIGTIKGSINFSKTLTRNHIHKEKHICSYTYYDKNNLYNCTLVEVLDRISSLTDTSDIKSWAKKLRLEFNGLPGLKKSDYIKLTNLKYDRKTINYKDSLDLAKMLLNLESPNFKPGSNNIITLLFDMNDLFEKYIAKMLSRSIRKERNSKLKVQNNKQFWEWKRIRPDLVIEENGRTIVLDTKWKQPEFKKPSDADLKQIFVYNEYYDCEVGILLYPSVPGLDKVDVSGQYHVNKKKCQMVYLDLFKDHVVNKDIGDELVKKLTCLKHK